LGVCFVVCRELLGVHAVSAFAVPMVANLVHHNVGVWTHDDEAFHRCVDEVPRDIGWGGVANDVGVAMRTE
jgi:hypothetical protein